jgi:hypothetical protein
MLDHGFLQNTLTLDNLKGLVVVVDKKLACKTLAVGTRMMKLIELTEIPGCFKCISVLHELHNFLLPMENTGIM